MNCRLLSLIITSRPIAQPGRRSFHGSSVRKAIKMPAMSPYMTEGTVRRWAKKEGDAFFAGDVLVQIESGYCGHIIDVEAQNSGIMAKILRPDGSTNIPIEQVIALVARTPQELADLQAQAQTTSPPLPTPAFPHLHQPRRHVATRTPSGPDSMYPDGAHRYSSNAVSARGMATDLGAQHHTPGPTLRPIHDPENRIQAAVLRKAAVSSSSRRDSGPPSIST
ncbi:hypothetical protein GGX14DRAFT_430636, partial [Mycena pura]